MKLETIKTVTTCYLEGHTMNPNRFNFLRSSYQTDFAQFPQFF